MDDIRALVFEKILDIVCHQAQHGLLVFLLENVRGILKSYHGRPPYINHVRQRLLAVAPWIDVRVHSSNTRCHGLPHNRPRVYVVGVHKELLRAAPWCVAPPAPLPPPSLFAMLDRTLPKTSAADWTPKMWSNITEKYLPHLLEDGFFSDPEFRETCAVLDACRDPDKAFGSFLRTDDVCNTLTTGNRYLVVVSGGEGLDLDSRGNVLLDLEAKPHISRSLTKEDRVTLQGLEHEVTRKLSTAQSCSATGNAYSAPAVARFMGPVIGAMTSAVGQELVRKVTGASPAAPVPRGLHRWFQPRSSGAAAAEPPLLLLAFTGI